MCLVPLENKANLHSMGQRGVTRVARLLCAMRKSAPAPPPEQDPFEGSEHPWALGSPATALPRSYDPRRAALDDAVSMGRGRPRPRGQTSWSVPPEPAVPAGLIPTKCRHTRGLRPGPFCYRPRTVSCMICPRKEINSSDLWQAISIICWRRMPTNGSMK